MKNIPTGEWIKNPKVQTNEHGLKSFDIDTEEYCSQISVFFDEKINSEVEEADDITSLICDAGNTYNKTQLLPSELLEQRNELLKTLKEIIEAKGAATNTQELFPVLQLINKSESLISKIEK